MSSTDTNQLSRRELLRSGAAGTAFLLLPKVMRGMEDTDPVAKTKAGRIRGHVVDGIHMFRGVPYGMDTAKTRFMAPRPVEPWKDVRDCFAWGPFWPQAAAQSLKIPLMMGNTHDETRFLGGVPGVNLFALEWDDAPAGEGATHEYNNPQGIIHALKAGGQMMRDFKPEDVVAKYRSWYPEYSPADVYFQITTDMRVWRTEQVAATKRAENPESAKRTWLYQMDWVSPAAHGRYKAPHTMDLPFAFDNVAVAPGMVGGSSEEQARAQALADAVSESYIAFAKTGDPNNAKIPDWPHFDLQNRPTMIFDDRIRVENDPRKEERLLIEQVPYVPNAV